MKRIGAIALFLATEVVPLAASICVGVFGTIWQFSKDGAWLFWTCLAALVAIAVPLVSRWERYARFIRWTLTSGRRAEALRHTLEAMLQRALESADRNDNRFRASLYYFHQGRFHMIARYSSNPQLSVQGRVSYSIDQGVIGRVWLEEFAIATMPKDPDKWVDHAVKAYGFSRSDAEKVSMRARKLGGFTIRSANRCVGVVMLETFEPADLSEKIIDLCRLHIEGTPLAEIVAKSATLFPAVEAFERNSRTTVTRVTDESAWVEVTR